MSIKDTTKKYADEVAAEFAKIKKEFLAYAEKEEITFKDWLHKIHVGKASAPVAPVAAPAAPVASDKKA